MPAPGPFGHQECDPAPSFWHEALKLMAREQPSPDFIFAGGDWIGHIPPIREGAPAVRSAAVLLASMLHRAFPSTPVMHAVGNHDTHPYYSVAPVWREWEAAWRASPELGDAYVQRHLPNAESLATFRSGGYYVRPLWPRPQQYPSHGLESGAMAEADNDAGDSPADAGRHAEAAGSAAGAPARTVWGIALNTNDLALSGGSEQLAWLRKVLGAIRSRGDTAILLGHIPPGPSHFELDSICAAGHYYQRAGGACWHPSGQSQLLDVLARHSDVLPTSFFGHHHTDSARLVTDYDLRGSRRMEPSREARARHLMLLSPSLTPRNPPHDPAIRLYRYSRASGALLDMSEFRLNVTRANRDGRATWTTQPSFRRTAPLNLSTMGAAEWARALRQMLHYDHRPHATEELSPRDPFLQWVSAERCRREAYVESGRRDVPPLRKCKLAHLCAALHVADAPYAECIGMGLPQGSGG